MTRRVAITGASGFLGWHLRARLQAFEPSTEVVPLVHGDLDDADELAARLEGCGVVFHLAAVNSHDPDEAATNVHLARVLTDGLAQMDRPPHVVHSNSSHHDRDTPYGRSKRSAAECLRTWAATTTGSVADVVLPNLFGEQGRPHYNSAVATFCKALVDGVQADVNSQGRTELLHAQDAADALLAHASPGDEGERVVGAEIAIPDLHDRLARMHDTYRSTQRVPALPTRLDLRLFNQLRSALFPSAYPTALVTHTDDRGAFFEAVRGSGDGQTSFSTTVPGVTRGNHWHLDKIERFLVLSGNATIEIRRLFDDTVRTFEVSGDQPAFVDMPTLHTHSITNIGDGELLTMFWANDHFDPAAPDTFAEPVRVAHEVAR